MAKAVLGLIGFVALFYIAVVRGHAGAPAPYMQCQPGVKLFANWFPDSAPQVQSGYAGAPAGTYPGENQAVHWFGYTGIPSCGQSLVATTGANP